MAMEPQLRGHIITQVIDWVTNTYGEALFLRALARLSPEDRATYSKKTFSIGWYPIESWDRLLDALRAEVLLATGEDGDTFDWKNVRGAGGKALDTIYRFMLSWVGTINVMARFPFLVTKIYNGISATIIRNEPGALIARVSGPLKAHDNARRHFLKMFICVLERSDVKNIEGSYTMDKALSQEFLLELKISYQ